jgi:hypothetical protein
MNFGQPCMFERNIIIHWKSFFLGFLQFRHELIVGRMPEYCCCFVVMCNFIDNHIFSIIKSFFISDKMRSLHSRINYLLVFLFEGCHPSWMVCTQFLLISSIEYEKTYHSVLDVDKIVTVSQSEDTRDTSVAKYSQ